MMMTMMMMMMIETKQKQTPTLTQINIYISQSRFTHLMQKLTRYTHCYPFAGHFGVVYVGWLLDGPKERRRTAQIQIKATRR